jgi:hypothetical protein
MPHDPVTAKPPRPIAPGDVVACFSDELGEWTAAQITDLNTSWKQAGVLELDWSGPEPQSVSDLGSVSPLVLTHHAWTGTPSHTNYPWVLPRSCKVIGAMRLLRETRSSSFSSGWRAGSQLARQRQWDGGVRHLPGLPGEIKLSGAELDAFLVDGLGADCRSLKVEDIRDLDCARLAEGFPRLTELILGGRLGHLANASSLNRLSSLKALGISNLFGMTKSDCLLPEAVPALEWLVLHSVPREYGSAMRTVWSRELGKGCFTAITALRSPEWLAENIDNPLRDWDGREHISAANFRKSVTQYKATRRAVIAALADPSSDHKDRLIGLGREYGAAFNKLAERDDFIETEEREELFAALIAMPHGSPSQFEAAAKLAGEWLAQGLEETRDW